MDPQARLKHYPGATFEYALNLVNSPAYFNQGTVVSAWLDVAIAGVPEKQRVDAEVEWLNCDYTLIGINAGILDTFSDAVLYVQLEHRARIYACNPIYVEAEY